MLVHLAALAALASDVAAEASLQHLPQGVAPGVGARLVGERGTFLSAEGRAFGDATWTGRATAGVDVFGCQDGLDVTLGLFLGSAGAVEDVSISADPTAGFEVGVGVGLGSLHGRFRHADGFRGPLEAWFTENEWRLGFRVLDRAEVFGQYVRYEPGDATEAGGFGAGVTVIL
jgi:hypothetical protein